ncbi:MAG: OmpA family protein [Bacteroidota bacterium]
MPHPIHQPRTHRPQAQRSDARERGASAGPTIASTAPSFTMLPRTQRGQLIQRKTPFHDKTREYDDDSQIPNKFNYELKSHKLIAHTVSSADVETILGMIRIVSLYSGTLVDEKTLREQLTKARGTAKEGVRVDIDVTTYLPAAVQNFMASMETYYQTYRDKVAKDGPRDDVFKIPAGPERDAAMKKWDESHPVYTPEYEFWSAVCHEFAMLTLGGAAQGKVGKGAKSPNDVDDDATREAYASSLKGEGPYRPVAANEVQVGDVAVFKAGKKIVGLPSRIVHSAVVIKVADGEVELLEKKNPSKPMATRTVGEVLKIYANDRVVVHYLSPALAGMPVKHTKNLGRSIPNETVEEARGSTAKDREKLHVLFRTDSDLLRAHEDLKLFQFILGQKGQTLKAKVHGYASEEGGEDYNYNLSAHRAVVVKRALLAQLTSSTISAVAHGETTAFGDRAQNRRAGIELLQPPSDGGLDIPPVEGEPFNPLLVPFDFNWQLDDPTAIPELPSRPSITSRPAPCTRRPRYPDFLGLLQQVECDVFENLENNAHHFALIQGLYPDRPDLQWQAFSRYALGANILETTTYFLGASPPWSDTYLPYGIGASIIAIGAATSGELTLDVPIPLTDNLNLELNLDILPESPLDSTQGEFRLQSGLTGRF